MNAPATPVAPPALPGFDHVHRYRDVAMQAWIARILPGEFYVSRGGEVISTVLGSCVAACIHDERADLTAALPIAGMNHFMLPDSPGVPSWGPEVSAATRYGSYAMERLINELLRHGARRQHLRAKLFGGARMFAGGADIGAGNIAFVRSYLETERIPVVAEDLGGQRGRKVMYATATGRVRIRLLGSDDALRSSEQQYRTLIAGQPVGGEVDLFD